MVYFIQKTDDAKALFKEIEGYNTLNQSIIVVMDYDGEEGGNDNILIISGNRNTSDVCMDLGKNVLKKYVGDSVLSLQDHSIMVKDFEFPTDEANRSCIEGKERADKIIAIVEAIPATQRKSKLLPLQGDLWKLYCIDEKEECKMKHYVGDKQSPDDYKDSLRTKRSEYRFQQRKIELTEAMKLFIDALSQDDSKGKKYFLQWFQLGLNKLSEEVMPKILRKYNECKKKTDRSTKEIVINQTLERTTKDFNLCSLGLEHFLRELGQLYEAYNSRDHLNKTTSVHGTNSHLPKLMAELIVLGYPLELMDGNVSGVPNDWLKAVLNELNILIGGKKLSVLSILCVQST